MHTLFDYVSQSNTQLPSSSEKSDAEWGTDSQKKHNKHTLTKKK